MSASAARRALVIGGSIAGLFAALMLRRAGWDVQVCERVATPLSGRGAGIVTHAALWRSLERVGLDPRHDFGVEVTQRLTLARDGGVVGTLHCPQTMTSWDRLFGLLRAAWPDDRYALGEEVCAVEQSETGVAARFTNGVWREADVLIGADGIRSTIRRLAVGEIAAKYAGYVAWRGLLAEAMMPPDAHAVLGGTFGFCLPEGEQILGYPVAGPHNDLRPGRRRYNFVWYRPADEVGVLANLLTDASGRVHEASIPPPLIRDAVIAAMRASAEAVLAPQFAAVVRATPQPFLQPIYDLESPLLATGRIALIGDAAFVARPHVGAGTTKASEDAAALVAALTTSATVADALQRYEAERLPEGRRIVQRARHLGAYMQSRQSTAEERAAAERHRRPEAVMAETALLNF